MKQEHKELLLKDLCARLPYGVKVRDELGRINKLVIGNADLVRLYYKDFSIYSEEKLSLPYLFPLSSMTKEQEEELNNLHVKPIYERLDPHTREEDLMLLAKAGYTITVWLFENHFDYLGLISMGLAIDATNLNIY